jgi:hypothetical protein
VDNSVYNSVDNYQTLCITFGVSRDLGYGDMGLLGIWG